MTRLSINSPVTRMPWDRRGNSVLYDHGNSNWMMRSLVLRPPTNSDIEPSVFCAVDLTDYHAVISEVNPSGWTAHRPQIGPGRKGVAISVSLTE
jgi:hypothetical protein